MQALAKKKLEEQKIREMLSTNETRTIEERVAHCRALQYDEHKGLFAVSHSSIHKAAADGSIDGLKFFLNPTRKPRVHFDDFDKSGFCPLHCAAQKGADQSIAYLIDQGCSVDVRSTYGDTALMHACKENRLDTIRLLFNRGADPTATNRAGFSAVHMAAQTDNAEAIQLLVELVCSKRRAEKAAALAAAAEGVEGGPSIALEESSVVSHNEDDSLSLLTSLVDPAVSAEVVALLSQASRNKTTPLHLAVMNNSLKVVDLLLAMKVNVNTQDGSGDTALHKAGRLQLNIAYQALLDAGASPSVKNNFGETPRDLLIDKPSY